MVRSLGVALACVAVGLLAVTAGEIALLAFHPMVPWWESALAPAAAGLVYAAAGLLAWWRRPSNRLGVILVAGAAVWLATGLGNAALPGLAAVGVVVATVPLGVVVHLVLAFPSGRLRSPTARWTVVVGYGVCLVLQVPLYLLDPAASPDGMLAVADRPGLANVAVWVQRCVGLAVVAITAGILTARLRAATRPQRRVLAVLYVYGVVGLITTPLVPTLLVPMAGMSMEVAGDIQVGLLTVAPVAFATATLLGGFARTGELAELGAWLGMRATGRPPLTSALARALGDDSVQVLYRVPDRPAYVDAHGRVVALPDAGTGRGVAPVEFGSRQVGAIVYDATLIGDPTPVAQAARVIAIAVEQQRLEVELRANQMQLRLSRIRILQAANQERQKIAQDLHDGLQADLVLLALQAQQLAVQPGTPPATATAAVELRTRIDQAAAGLRNLVRSVMPAPLVERGLAEATEDLVDRIPVPTRLEFDVPQRLPTLVANTAYFIVAEALGNAVKHASASALTVRLAQLDHTLTLEVSDNGVGGARPTGGLGLRGLADRVDALGGRLRLESPAGQGTRVLVELPCGS